MDVFAADTPQVVPSRRTCIEARRLEISLRNVPVVSSLRLVTGWLLPFHPIFIVSTPAGPEVFTFPPFPEADDSEADVPPVVTLVPVFRAGRAVFTDMVVIVLLNS